VAGRARLCRARRLHIRVEEVCGEALDHVRVHVLGAHAHRDRGVRDLSLVALAERDV
jgi:hypothetical protein